MMHGGASLEPRSLEDVDVKAVRSSLGLSFSEVLAVLLVCGTLVVTVARLRNDDTLQMADRVVEMSRSEPTSQLMRTIRIP